MVPAMIYLLGMPTAVVVGTSLFHIIFVTANVTYFLQAVNHHTVDILLAAIFIGRRCDWGSAREPDRRSFAW